VARNYIKYSIFKIISFKAKFRFQYFVFLFSLILSKASCLDTFSLSHNVIKLLSKLKLNKNRICFSLLTLKYGIYQTFLRVTLQNREKKKWSLSAAEYAFRNRIVDRICTTGYILNRICFDERKEEVRYENEKFLL